MASGSRIPSRQATWQGFDPDDRTIQKGSGGNVAKKKTDDISIGKFDILATYTYAKGLHDGLDDDEAK